MKYTWDKKELEEAVKASISYSGVLRRLNIPIQGQNSSTLKKKIQEYNIDTSHFTFKSEIPSKSYIEVSMYLNSDKQIGSSKLKKKLLKEGIKQNKCEICGIDSWLGKPITLQLHHINGDHNDNSLENLQLLCPNCHSQTDNFCGSANTKQEYYCQECGNQVTRGAKYCTKCSAKHRRKVERPSKEELIALYKEYKSMSAISRKYGVSDKTISKWFVYYSLPGKASELKQMFCT